MKADCPAFVRVKNTCGRGGGREGGGGGGRGGGGGGGKERGKG